MSKRTERLGDYSPYSKPSHFSIRTDYARRFVGKPGFMVQTWLADQGKTIDQAFDHQQNPSLFPEINACSAVVIEQFFPSLQSALGYESDKKDKGFRVRMYRTQDNIVLKDY